MLVPFKKLSMVASLLFSLVGVFIGLVSLNVLGIWLGLELSFLAVICFASGSNVEEAESCMMYFIVQVLGSCVCGMGFLMTVNMVEVTLSQYLIFIGMMMKLGVFPFHFWVPPVVSKLSWAGCGSILFLQKMIPLWLLSNYVYVSEDLNRVEILASLTSLVGSLGGINVLNYRVTMGYSSVQNLGPMLLLCCCQEFYLLIYFSLYMMISGFLMIALWEKGVYGFQDLIKDKDFSDVDEVWWISLYFLSLAGVPPFSGSTMKVSLLLGSYMFMPLGTGFCILTSTCSLYFYLSVILSMVVNWGKSYFSRMGTESMGNKKILSSASALSLLINLVGGFVLFLCVSL